MKGVPGGEYDGRSELVLVVAVVAVVAAVVALAD